MSVLSFSLKSGLTSVNTFETIEVFPKCFPEFSEFSNKNICHYSIGAQTCNLLCKRSGCYHNASKTGSRGVFSIEPNSCFSDKFIRFPEFAESSAPFRKNSFVFLKVVLYNIEFTAMCLVTNCKQSCFIDH